MISKEDVWKEGQSINSLALSMNQLANISNVHCYSRSCKYQANFVDELLCWIILFLTDKKNVRLYILGQGQGYFEV
jgi:hypothetical protein